MDNGSFTLSVLGTRGSIPISRGGLFGGATSCYLVQAGDQAVFLDAGSGLISAPVHFETTPVILLTHLHLDHILGLGMYPRLSQKGLKTELYLRAQDDADARRQLDALYSPPFWPCSLCNYAGELCLHALSTPLRFGELLVESMPGEHPGGSVVYRLRYAGKSLVYATDFEHGRDSFDELADFARGADLLMYDGQYSEELYANRRGFGHSTPDKGLELLERAGAGRLLIIHHDPQSSDEQLLRQEEAIGDKRVHFAREGETWTI